MLKSQSILLANRLQLAVHFLAFVFVASSLFIYSTVSAADDKRSHSVEKRVERLSQELKLTEQQKKDVTAVLEESRSEMEKFRNSDASKEERREMRRNFQSLRENTETRIVQILTEEQRAQYQKIRTEKKAEMRDRMKEKMQERRQNR